MSKILAVSDIHIHDYPNRNPFEKARLYQSRIVAQNIIEVGKSMGADRIVFAGDILEKAINRPYVLAETKLFLDTVMREFKEGFIVWGNHDQDNKGADQDFIDSSLGVMLPGNLYYADKKEIVIDNSRIAFSNWYPKFDLSWIQDSVDVLFTHATISYTLGGQEKYKSQNQELDQSKFGIAFCGDIHKRASIDKFVSIGVPQRCKMGDSSESSGVIYDCVTKEWSWVDLNPHDNLIKFDYTSDIKQEGWNENLKTWLVYKPDTLGISGSGVREVKVPEWDDINNLINNIITENGLSPVHNTILEYLNEHSEYKEVDFNFSLKKLYCKNWRSIEECTIYFDDRDRILIQGKNGSGKSSLLSAIKYAFIEYSGSLKDFIQFGSKSCLTEVDFVYQGALYKISRGFRSGKPVFGLEINGNPQKYNNKKEFDEDMHIRFPFIDYMDIYFFNSDHSRLIGDPEMKRHPERLAELISKFFKLDKIDSYNGMAEGIRDGFEKSISEWELKIKESDNVLQYIKTEVDSINLPSEPKESLMSFREEGMEIERKSKLWSDYVGKVSPMKLSIEVYSKDINNIQLEISKLRDDASLDYEISEIDKEISRLTTELLDIKSSGKEYDLENRVLGSIAEEGKKVSKSLENLDNTNICPTCHRAITSREDLEKHREELKNKLSEITDQYIQKRDYVRELYKKRQESQEKEMSLKEGIGKLRKAIEERRLQKSRKVDLMRELDKKRNSVESLKTQLMNMSKPEEVILPDNFTSIMIDLNNKIDMWNRYDVLQGKRLEEEQKIQFYNKELEKIKRGMYELENYIRLTGPTGKIYEEIMTKLAQQFTDGNVKYEVESYNFKRKDHLALKSSYNNNGNYVPYDSCSDGQKTVLDVHFISKIVTGMGLLVMDEFLKHLDPSNHDICLETISSMNIGCILLSSHMESVGGFNNKTCNLELNDSGITMIDIK